VTDGIKWKDAAEAINKIGQQQGWIAKDTVTVSWDEKRLGGLDPSRPIRPLYLWGSNSRAESARLRKLGWVPRGPLFWEALEEDCAVASKLRTSSFL
jgi:hypothetical protein